MNISRRSSGPSGLAATAPLTFCAALGSAEAAITVVEVNVEVDGSTIPFGTFDSLSLALPGAAALHFFHTIGPVFTAPPPLPGRARAGITAGGIFGFAGQGNYIANFGIGGTPGTLIAFASGILDHGYYGPDGQFGSPGTSYLSFIFDGGNGVQGGWAELDMDGIPFNSFTVVRYAYADPGEFITVGQVPEPNTLALLALGAAGVLTQRRRRAKSSPA